MRILRKVFLFALPAILLAHPLAAAPTDGPSAVVLSPHRAIYDLSLAQSRRGRALEAVRGRILYDFSGSGCEGYTLHFRQVTELDSGEGKVAVSDLRTENWESGDGRRFRFSSHNYLNNEPTDASEGSAERGESVVTVTLKRPVKKTFEIKEVVFPSEQMRRIIGAARAGKTLLDIGVYDGSENGERVYTTLTVIGQPIKPRESPPSGAVEGEKSLVALTRWPITVSYFDRAKVGVDQTPLYSIAFELYENGIARALRLDYGDFALSGPMTSLELKDAKPCP